MTLWGKGLDIDADEEKGWKGGCVSSNPIVSLGVKQQKYFAYIISPAFCATNPCIYAKSKSYKIFQNIYITLQASECNVYNILENYHKKERINSPRQKVYIDLMI